MTYAEKLKDPRWQKKSGIYKITINNCIYVGSAINISKRLRSHINELKRGRHANTHLQRAFNKYMVIDCDVLEFIDNAELLITREQYYIDLLEPKYNIAPKAGSQLGFRHSEKTRELLSRLQIGRKISEEARKNMSAAMKGKVLSADHIRKISLAKMGEKNPFYKAGVNHPQYGTHRSQATILKLTGDGNKNSNTGVMYDVETGSNYVFRSLRSICRKLNINYSSMKGARRKEIFLKNKWYASFTHIPKGIETKIFPSNGPA